MEENKKRFILWAAVGLVIALGIVILVFSGASTDSAKKMIEQTTQPTTQQEVVPQGASNAPVPNSAEIPQASVVQREKLPEGTIELSISSSEGFSPNTFTVRRGQKVTLALTSKKGSHTFAFKDPLLAAVSLNAKEGQTSAVNFVAPEKSGEYVFRCDLPGHEDNGEVGKMIVE